MNEVEHVLGVQNALGEGCIWQPREQMLYWVDIWGECIHRLDPATGTHAQFEIGLPAGCLGFRAGGGLVMGAVDRFALWDPDTQALRDVASLDPDRPGGRINDGAVDRQGRFWAGTMSGQPVNGLYRLDPDGSVQQMDAGFTVSNGIGWSPDGGTMYFTDSRPRVIYAYDFDPASGAIENRRTFASIPEGEGVPDGLVVDSEGFVWSARWDGWRVSRHDPEGKVEREIRLPVQRPTSCTFGGPELDELYVTSAWRGLSEAEWEEQPLAGDVFRIRTGGIKGLPESEFELFENSSDPRSP